MKSHSEKVILLPKTLAESENDTPSSSSVCNVTAAPDTDDCKPDDVLSNGKYQSNGYKNDSLNGKLDNMFENYDDKPNSFELIKLVEKHSPSENADESFKNDYSSDGNTPLLSDVANTFTDGNTSEKNVSGDGNTPLLSEADGNTSEKNAIGEGNTDRDDGSPTSENTDSSTDGSNSLKRNRKKGLPSLILLNPRGDEDEEKFPYLSASPNLIKNGDLVSDVSPTSDEKNLLPPEEDLKTAVLPNLETIREGEVLEIADESISPMPYNRSKVFEYWVSIATSPQIISH